MRKEFDIFVDDHILKWAKKELWDDSIPPYKINESTVFGKLIYGLLIDKREINKLVSDDAKSILKVELSDTLAKRSPDPIKLNMVNNILEQLFRIHLQKWVDAQFAFGNNRYNAMLNFFKQYDIESNQRIINRYQKYVQRTNSRLYKAYKQRMTALNETKSQRTNI